MEEPDASGDRIANGRMLSSTPRSPALRVRGYALAVVLAVVGSGPGVVHAQERPAPAVEIAAGWVGFADDGVVGESLIGGAGRVYVSPRVAVGPELAVIRGLRHHHLVVTGNVTFDLLASRNGRRRRFAPFVIAGAGVFQTRQEFPSGAFRSSEGAFTLGGGARALLGDHLTAGVEARLGWELHLRLNGVLGWQFGR